VATKLEYADNPYARPAAEAKTEDRVAFLRKVAGLTFVGLVISATTSMITAGLIALLSDIMMSRGVSLVLMLGSLMLARMVGGRMVRSETPSVQYAGFAGGTALQGVAMGYLILTALLFSAARFGNPLVLLVEAMVLVALTMFGMCVYLLTGPKKLSMVGGFLSAVSLPMLLLMVVSFVFPSLFGGVFGMIINVVFVLISAAGLLYSLNSVMHRMSTDMVVPAAYYVTMGILTLFWNILTLLMRLQRR